MGATRISWSHYTFNPWMGCSRVSPGCAHCYAEVFTRNRMGLQVWDGKHVVSRKFMRPTYWKQLRKWNADAQQTGERKRVFCGSLCDVFEQHREVSINDHMQEARERLFEEIPTTPFLDWLLLTKRPENVLSMLPAHWVRQGLPNNVWIGTSIENQYWANIRLPIMQKIPAQVRFLSCEPLLGPVDLNPWLLDGTIKWVIVGGESGSSRRPLQLAWAQSLWEQSIQAQVPFWFKQISAARPGMGEDALGMIIQQLPASSIMGS